MRNLLKLTGRTVSDIRVNKTQNNNLVTTLRIAVQNDFKNKEGGYETEFFNITLWNNDAEYAEKCIQKGDLVEVNGRLSNHKDEKGKDSIQIVSNRIDLLSKSKTNKPLQNDLEEDREI